MAFVRTSIAIRQDLKHHVDQLQGAFEAKLGLPKNSLSPQVFVLMASSLGVSLLEAFDATIAGGVQPVPPDQLLQNVQLLREQIRSQTMLLQLSVNQQEAIERKQAAVGAAAALGLLGLGLGAYLAARGKRP